MPGIWGNRGPVFDDEGEAQEIIGLVMGRYNHIAPSLNRKGKYQPLLDLDTDESFLWEIWAEGFAKALDLRPDAWSLFLDHGEKPVAVAFASLAQLAEQAITDGKLSDQIDTPLRTLAPDLIADCLEHLHKARLEDHRQNQPPKSIGRNDPCPCGSGKKI